MLEVEKLCCFCEYSLGLQLRSRWSNVCYFSMRFSLPSLNSWICVVLSLSLVQSAFVTADLASQLVMYDPRDQLLIDATTYLTV